MRAPARKVLPGEPGKLLVPKLHCVYCAKPVPKGRRRWCSQECVDEYLIRNDPGRARGAVFERDHGVCSECDRDTEKLAAKIGTWLACDWRVTEPGARTTIEHLDGPEFARAQNRRAIARRFGVRLAYGGGWSRPPWPDAKGLLSFELWTLWEMDHVVPVVEGGGGCGLENLRTLCRCCHKRATAELARKRLSGRRLA